MKFKMGDKVRKTSGSQWKGTVVGTYSTELTPEGYAVESSAETGSVQIYPAKALELWDGEAEGYTAVDMATARAEGFRDGLAAVKPAPAQDELWAVHAQGPDELYAAFSREDAEQHAAALNSLPAPEWLRVSAVVVPSPWSAAEHWKYAAELERDHSTELKAMATRPAQTEQQPVLPGGCVHVPEARETGAWESARIGDFNAGWNACRDSVLTLLEKAAYMELDTTERSIAIQDQLRATLAAPIAQTAPQPVMMPAYRTTPDQSTFKLKDDWQNRSMIDAGFNTALDEVARLNVAPQTEQSGLVLMPKEATPEIVAAMKRELDKAPTWYCRYSAAYRAALSAQGGQ